MAKIIVDGESYNDADIRELLTVNYNLRKKRLKMSLKDYTTKQLEKSLIARKSKHILISLLDWLFREFSI